MCSSISDAVSSYLCSLKLQTRLQAPSRADIVTLKLLCTDRSLCSMLKASACCTQAEIQQAVADARKQAREACEQQEKAKTLVQG